MSISDLYPRAPAVLPAIPPVGTYPGAIFRVGAHLYIDLTPYTSAIIQIDPTQIIGNTLPNVAPTDATTLGLFDFNRARPDLAVVDFTNFPRSLGLAAYECRQAKVAATGNGVGGVIALELPGSGTLTSAGTPGGNGSIFGSPDYLSSSRSSRITTTTTAGTSAGYVTQLGFQIGNAGSLTAGGFFAVFRFAVINVAAGHRAFVGLYGGTTVACAQNLGSGFNLVGLGFDSTDTTWQLITNDASGAATKTAIPASFAGTPTSGAQSPVLELRMWSPTGKASVIYWYLANLTTPSLTPITGTITTDLPASFLGMQANVNNGALTSTPSMQLLNMLVETPS